MCQCDIPDSVIAMKCGVPKDKITRLRKDKYKINMMNSKDHAESGFSAETTLREEANAIVANIRLELIRK